MAINPVQPNIENTKSHIPYREAKGTIKTDKNVKPLPPEGHLVHDSWTMLPKYFLKDIAYDMKAVKDGFQGNANDHQLGRLNDVGLKLGGIGIATMLAARTKNPMVRIMEYAGLGAFLAAMSIYPQVAINAPSRIVQGFDIGKEYIDDQGRKKSVLQDPNYIPFDMYQGDYPGEDLDIIGDRLGIPRGVKNRDDLTKEQMRKIGIQNNTLWMMTAASVPVFSALICCGLEKLIAPALEKARNSRYNSKINHALNVTEKMSEQINSIPANKLSKDVEKILVNYKNQELPKAEFDNLMKLFTKNMDANASEGIKADLEKIFMNEKNGVKSYLLPDNLADDIAGSIKENLSSRNRATLEKVFVPSTSEINEILGKAGSKEITEEQLQNIKGEFRKLFEKNMENESGISKTALKAYENEVLDSISKKIKGNSSNYVSENNIKDVVDFAKVMGEFKENQKVLDKCKSFKIEYAPETVIARSYGKFESTLLDVLDIKYKDLKQISESDKYAQEIFEKKLEALTKDEVKYQKAIEKLSKVMSEMEVNLNGKNDTASHMKDLISGIENNYNNTAKRLNNIGKFQNTIDRLVKEDVSTLSNSVKSRKDLYEFLDGVRKDKYAGLNYWNDLDEAGRLEYAKYNSKGVGSSKNLEISRIVERYQGANNSFNRILHLFDVYKRPISGGGYDKEILAKGKEALMTATSSDHTLKLNTINNPEYYKDLMRTIWLPNLDNTTQKGLDASKDLASGNIQGRLKSYIQRFQDIIGNNNIDFTKPQHILNGDAVNNYTKSSRTRMAKFNLVAQNPVDLIKNAAGKRYGNQKWLRIASGIGGAVFGTAILAQFGFGKIRNPQNIQKQVNDDANS